MIPRRLQSVIEQSLAKDPVVGLLGPLQVGKTTLAKEIKQRVKEKVVYLDLELSSDQGRLQDPELYLDQFADRLVIIDEIQRMPSLFPLIRARVDSSTWDRPHLVSSDKLLKLWQDASSITNSALSHWKKSGNIVCFSYGYAVATL
jgi:uncharacterized protein